MLQDQFGRVHNYLRLSLTERCNLRCFYCMPAEGIQLSPKDDIMRTEEIEKIAGTFVKLGINKIRFTGGEPLIRKDFDDVAMRLSKFNCELAITTNGILVDQYLPTFKQAGIKKINISLDTLNEEKFNNITRRDYFIRVKSNIDLLFSEGITPKLNVVLIRGVNDDELIDFINLTSKWNTTIQFIEFMPFQGNKWDLSRTVKADEILSKAFAYFGEENVMKAEDKANDTSRKYQIKGFKGNFGLISTVSNPFCDSCNRIRLTANGSIKNCLFSGSETNLLKAMREGKNLEQLIQEAIYIKSKQRGGIQDFSSKDGLLKAQENRSMIMIGG
ncbi:MAG: GTP 3',8-cyclase MoaA [Sphingobacteriaceae bacterium]|nr:GTP 3',8-cyclase MoaA [Sphingobacteriaceae bacterium]